MSIMAEFIFCTDQEGDANYFQKRIVIIGAGISGLACGSHLKKLGFNNVCILEARDRIGGRIQTIEGGTNSLDLGAQFIHGVKNNIIYKIADTHGLLNSATYNYLDAIFSFRNLPQKEKEAITMLLTFLEDKINSISVDLSNVDLSNYLKKNFKVFISDFGLFEYKDCLNAAFDWYCKLQCELNGCLNLTDVSASLFRNYHECDGNQTIEIKNGYASVLNVFLKTIPSDWILKNKIVTHIDWSDFNAGLKAENKIDENIIPINHCQNIKVICEDGNMYFADHVIVTISLGCLKKYADSLFVPTLSETKQAAIRCLGFGVVNKVYLEFKKPFWEAPTVINVLWGKSFEEKVLRKLSHEFEDSSKLWLQFINRFAYTPNHPNILCAWVVGEGAVIMESLSEDKIVKDSMALLELLLNKELPMPNSILRSTWLSDPFACGSYTYLSIKCEEEGISNLDLAKPEYAVAPYCTYPVLMFAGEATHDSYYSTVHGACETGIREANRLFKYYSNLELSEMRDVLKSVPNMTLTSSSNQKTLRNDLHVVIVGAGISGLACCQHLLKNNFTKITMLEAQGKAGGRVSSINFNDNFLELGAQWIHGKNNALFKFAKEYDLLNDTSVSFSYEGAGTFCTADGDVVESGIVEEVKKVLCDAKADLEKGCYDTKSKKSVLNFLSEAFDSYIQKCDNNSDISTKRCLFDWFLKFEIIDNGCDDLNNVAVQSFTEWDDCPEEMYHIDFKRGFVSLLNILMSQIPKSLLRLNKPVETIKWTENFKMEALNNSNPCLHPNDCFAVELSCEDGQKFYADVVIVTVSAGFLKENISSFFIPPLPDNKIEAFKAIGFGTINKIYLIYDKPFWSLKDKGFHLIWKMEKSKGCEKLLSENPWIKGITGFDVLQKHPNVLLGWIGGEEAKMMECITEEVVSAICTKVLQIFLDRPDIPKPLQVLRSCWYSNPYIKGSYSYRTPDYYQDCSTLPNLEYPLCCSYIIKEEEIQLPMLLFAGEAFDKSAFSSAHGAFHSGLKAADCLVKACCKIEDVQLLSCTPPNEDLQ